MRCMLTLGNGEQETVGEAVRRVRSAIREGHGELATSHCRSGMVADLGTYWLTKSMMVFGRE